MTDADPTPAHLVPADPAPGAPADPAPADPESLTADIERSRAQLADSVAELMARTDVRARAHAAVADLQRRVADTAARLRQDGISAGRKNWPQLAAAAAATAALAVAALAVRRRRR